MLLILLIACDGDVSEPTVDADGDGYTTTDCDDTAADAHPGAVEVCDGLDNDCNGEIDEVGGLTLHADADGDSYGDPALSATLCEPGAGWVGNFDDCDDTSADNYPGAEEVCDGIDNDCDGLTDDDDEGLTIGDWAFDSDGDGYGADLRPQRCSYEEGYVLEHGDCDDKDITLSPGVDEVCDGIDNDCDGLIDAEDDSAIDAAFWYPDADGDGYGDERLGVFSCTDIAGQINVGGDCEDADPDINPGLSDIVGNSTDDNCNGLEDELLLRDAAVTWQATYESDHAGYSVAGAGDVDGDGRADLLIGAPGNDVEGEDAGASFLIRGGLRGDLIDLNDSRARVYGEQYSDRSGAAVAGAGDVNGDGYDDVLIGAPDRGVSAGAAYLMLGPISGRMELDEADYRMASKSNDDRAGASLSGAGDVDGDGLADILIGAPGIAGEAGAVYLFTADDVRSGSLLNATTRITGRSDEQLGTAVSAGDFDGDGFSDLLLGAPESNDGGHHAGSAHVFLGDELSGGMTITDDDAILEGESTFDQLGTSVSGTGDINRDGYDDILAGAPEDDNGHINGGGVMLVFGSAALPGTLTADARFLGGFYVERAGQSVSIVGDVDDDNRADILIGAPGNQVAGIDAGAAYLVYGGNLSGTRSLPTTGQILIGQSAGDQAGFSVSGAGDVDGDGRDDLLIGSPGQSDVWPDGGAASLVLGSAL